MAPIGARVRHSVVLLALLAACRDGTAPGGPPARVAVTSGATFSGVAGTLLETPLGVRVTDEDGRPVRGVEVRFAVVLGSGSVSPPLVVTGPTGTAQTRLTFGSVAGDQRVVARVAGVEGVASFIGLATAGPAARLVITPGQARLGAVGETARLRAGVYDALGNVLTGVTVTWTSADPDVFTIDETGLVTATKALAVGRAIARAGDRADTAYVVVANPEVSPCLGYPNRVTLAVGQSIAVSMMDGVCIASAGGGDEYVLIPWHGSSAGNAGVALQVTGSGLTAVSPSSSLAPATAELSFALGRASGRSSDPDRSFELERRIREAGRREVMPMASRARAAFDRRSTGDARPAAIPNRLGVGELVHLNTNAGASCTAPTMRTGRVAAISARAVVVHDTANPAGGFTDVDYSRFAVTFDTLVAPVNDAAFGTPTDIDGNGKVVIFFTRAVNELTPAGANFYYGGFFHPRDLLPKQGQDGASVCATSNEGEMFYMLVPDPSGIVNGNARRLGFVDSVTVGTLAHEYQHLVNTGRRLYVDGAGGDEEVWLNEGLSHIAEELVFYRAAGLAPRQNIGGERFGAQAFNALFTQYMAPNFGRLRAYLQSPQNFSPYGGGDELATRGAAWAFLRYAADRRGSGDGDVWMRLVNTKNAGIQNLKAVFGPDVLNMVRDWTSSMYLDDHVPGVSAALTQPSWNFRSAWPLLPTSPRAYPLTDVVRTMSDGTSHNVSLRGGSGAFLRFGVAEGREASIRVTAAGRVPPATVQATIVRRQ